MDDEEAKRIQEERDKQLTEEYKELQNPKKPDWDVIDPPMKGQGLVNEALMIGGSRLGAAAFNPLLKTIGPAGAIDAGINILTGESDTPFEKKLEIFKPAKVAVKSTRLLTNMLTDVFDKRVAKPVMESTADKVYAHSTDPLGTPRKKSEIQIRSELGTQLGFKREANGQFVFSWDKLSKQSKKLGNASYWRRKGATYFTSPPNKADFTKYRAANIDAFIDEWEPYLKLDPMYESRKQFKRYIELHHITPLTISAPLFDNLAHDGKEYRQLFDLLKKNFLTPGDMEKNFFLTLKRPHQLLHDKFYVDTIGKQGEKFFNSKRMELINSGPDGRLAVAKEYIKTIKDGEGIIKDAMNYLSLVYRTNKKIPPEELVEQLTKLPYSPKYRLRDMDKMVREIIEKYDVKKTLFKPKPTTKPRNLVKESKDERLIKEGLDILDVRAADKQLRKNKKKRKYTETQYKLDLDGIFGKDPDE